MINHIEKGRSLKLVINEAGYYIGQEGRVWTSSNDVAVQAIIDNYDPLPWEQLEAKQRILEQSEKSVLFITSKYPRFEIDTFTIQRQEALAFQANNNAITPNIDRIATRRGKTRAQVASRIITKSAQYEELMFNTAGERQRLEDLIDNESDWMVVRDINFSAVT